MPQLQHHLVELNDWLLKTNAFDSQQRHILAVSDMKTPSGVAAVDHPLLHARCSDVLSIDQECNASYYVMYLCHLVGMQKLQSCICVCCYAATKYSSYASL